MNVVVRVVSYLHKRYKAGLYQGIGGKYVNIIYEKTSITHKANGYIKTKLRKPKKEKVPVISESIQLIWVLGAGIFLLIGYLIAEPTTSLVDRHFCIWIILIIISLIVLYRLYEILLFTIHWVFLAREVFSSRRSLISFFINLLEIALLYAFIFIVIGCHQRIPDTLWYSIMNIVTIGFAGPESFCCLCKLSVLTELVIADFIILTCIANLAGVIKKRQIG